MTTTEAINMIEECGMTVDEVKWLVRQDRIVTSPHDNNHLITSRHPDFKLNSGDVVIGLRGPIIHMLFMVDGTTDLGGYRIIRVEDGCICYEGRDRLRLIARDGDDIPEEWLKISRTKQQQNEIYPEECKRIRAKSAVAHHIWKEVKGKL